MKRLLFRTNYSQRRGRRQSNRYDRIVTETYGTSPQNFALSILSDLLKGLSRFKLLSVKFERTVERIGDFLFKAIDDATGREIIVHLEFQTTYNGKIKFRMYLYSAMITEREGKMPFQYVIYMGNEAVPLTDGLDGGHRNHFEFEIIRLIDFDPELFLNSDNPMEVIFAILCKVDDPKSLIRSILTRIRELTKDEKGYDRIFRMFVNLSALREYDEQVIKEDNMALARILVENDICYRKGRKEAQHLIDTINKDRERLAQENDELLSSMKGFIQGMIMQGRTPEEIIKQTGIERKLVEKIMRTINVN